MLTVTHIVTLFVGQNRLAVLYRLLTDLGLYSHSPLDQSWFRGPCYTQCDPLLTAVADKQPVVTFKAASAATEEFDVERCCFAAVQRFPQPT